MDFTQIIYSAACGRSAQHARDPLPHHHRRRDHRRHSPAADFIKQVREYPIGNKPKHSRCKIP